MKADALADVVIAHEPGITSMKLQKLLYYIEAWHLAVTGQPLIDEEFKGYAEGPVVPSVWHARKDRATRRSIPDDLPDLSDDAEAIVRLVLSEYGGRSGDELSALTHVETPWIEARAGMEPGAKGSRRISKDSMARFFRDHRKLGSRTAADLASGGLVIRDPARGVDMDELLDEFTADWPEDDAVASDTRFWPIDDVDHVGVEVPQTA